MNSKQIKILTYAQILFIENGVKKTTMDELAEKANVSKVTIYKYFGSKDNLCFEVGSWILNDYNVKIFSISNEPFLVKEAMIEMISVISDFIASGKLSLCMSLANLNEKLKLKFDLFWQEYEISITKLVELAQEKNIIKRSSDKSFVFYYIDMGISYFQHNIQYRKKMLEDEQFKDDFMKFLMSHIFNEVGEYDF